MQYLCQKARKGEHALIPINLQIRDHRFKYLKVERSTKTFEISQTRKAALTTLKVQLERAFKSDSFHMKVILKSQSTD